jgi:hypothetical protein
MRVLGVWIGWGPGPSTDATGKVIAGADDDPKVADFKAKLRKRFSKSVFAQGNDTSTIYTDALMAEVMRVQSAWGLPVTGIIDYKFQVKAGWEKPPATSPFDRPKGILFTCQGTVPSTMWDGPPAFTARAVEDLYYFQPIGGPYGAFPMNNSIDQEKDELRRQLTRREFVGKRKSLAGYSQGAIVISEVFFNDIQPENGALHYLLPDMHKAVTWGNPCREQGVENGNRYAGAPLLGKNSRGIMEESRRNKGTPSWWLDFANKKDIYCDTPNTEQGEDYTAICKIIMGNFYGGPDSIFSQLWELGMNPFGGAIGAAQAILGAGMFFGGGIKPHITYNIDPAISYLRSN